MSRFSLLILMVSGALSSVSAHADWRLCDTVLFKEGKISINSNEKVLVCGSDKASPAWREVPLAQAEYQIRVFLQNSGYLEPRFEKHGNELHVWIGKRTTVDHFDIEGGAGILDPSRVRQVIGEPLTSDLLDRLQRWAELELKSNGYPCPQIEVTAQAWDRRIIIRAKPGKLARIGVIEWENGDELANRVLARYQAMKSGDLYDVRESQITSNRMFTDGLFEMVNLQPECRGDIVNLKIKTSVGAPRFLRFGVGASTEELPFADLSFKNSRLNRVASSFYAIGHASPKSQTLTAGADFFPFKVLPRLFWGPRIKAGRQSENEFEVVSAKTGVDIGRYWDQFGARWSVRGGPTLNYVNTVTGIGPQESTYLNWEASVQAASHPYEYAYRDQFEGWTGRFDYNGQRDQIGSNINVDRFDVDFKYLWNINFYQPPLFILASRVSAVAVNAHPVDLSTRRDLLPVEYRIFWGGDQNLRGFSRQQLNNSGLGYLTGLYGGFELRLIEELPYRLQPFLLLDVAQLGMRRWTLDPALFSSYGAGLRWPSPIGTLRGSAAKGQIDKDTPATENYKREWVYFFSFGQEF